MDLYDYQQEARKTAFYPNMGNNLWYPALGLAGEAGEVANKIKKIYRDHSGKMTDADMLAIVEELGDTLWYVAALADEIGQPLSVIATTNLKKLKGRQERKTLDGSGDNR